MTTKRVFSRHLSNFRSFEVTLDFRDTSAFINETS